MLTLVVPLTNSSINRAGRGRRRDESAGVEEALAWVMRWHVKRKATTFFFFFNPPAGKEIYSLSSPHFHVFTYTSCVDSTQLPSQSSWFSGVSFGSHHSDSVSCP